MSDGVTHRLAVLVKGKQVEQVAAPLCPCSSTKHSRRSQEPQPEDLAGCEPAGAGGQPAHPGARGVPSDAVQAAGRAHRAAGHAELLQGAIVKRNTILGTISLKPDSVSK